MLDARVGFPHHFNPSIDRIGQRRTEIVFRSTLGSHGFRKRTLKKMRTLHESLSLLYLLHCQTIIATPVGVVSVRLLPNETICKTDSSTERVRDWDQPRADLLIFSLDVFNFLPSPQIMWARIFLCFYIRLPVKVSFHAHVRLACARVFLLKIRLAAAYSDRFCACTQLHCTKCLCEIIIIKPDRFLFALVSVIVGSLASRTQ